MLGVTFLLDQKRIIKFACNLLYFVALVTLCNSGQLVIPVARESFNDTDLKITASVRRCISVSCDHG